MPHGFASASINTRYSEPSTADNVRYPTISSGTVTGGG